MTNMKFRTTKSNYKDLVGLDHFYVGFTKREIRDLKALRKLPYCTFARVQSGKDKWQGVYWTSTHQSYFEMIESPLPGDFQFGLAISANQIQYCDIRRLKSFFSGPRLLKSSIRRIGKDKWFESLFSAKKSSAVFMWAMHYFFFERRRKMDKRNKPSLIERFTELEIAVNPVFLTQLAESCYWVPMRKRKRGSILELEFSNKDRSPFRVKCHIDPKVEFTTFRSLKAQASPFQIPVPVMKYFKVIRRSGEIILIRKP